MKTRRIDGTRVLQPENEKELREALNSGRPFQASRGARETVWAPRGPARCRGGRRRRPRFRGGPRMTDSPKPPPIEEVRIGTVKAAIWKNDTTEGGVYHNVTFSRLYRTDEGDWRE